MLKTTRIRPPHSMMQIPKPLTLKLCRNLQGTTITKYIYEPHNFCNIWYGLKFLSRNILYQIASVCWYIFSKVCWLNLLSVIIHQTTDCITTCCQWIEELKQSYRLYDQKYYVNLQTSYYKFVKMLELYSQVFVNFQMNDPFVLENELLETRNQLTMISDC